MKQERAGLTRFEMLDLADVESVIACGMDVDDAGDEMRRGSFNDRNLVFVNEADLQAFDRAAGEMIAEVLLILGRMLTPK